MSKVKQINPGVELTSPCSCLVYWASRGLAKIMNIYRDIAQIYEKQNKCLLTSGFFFYIQTQRV